MSVDARIVQPCKWLFDTPLQLSTHTVIGRISPLKTLHALAVSGTGRWFISFTTAPDTRWLIVPLISAHPTILSPTENLVI